MASADIVIAIVVLLSSVIGLVRGLLKEVLSLGIWFSAFVLALYFSPLIAEILVPHISDESIRMVASFFLVFIGTLIVGAIIQWLVKQLVAGTGLTGTDRFLGFLFGSARGVLVCIIALIALRPFAEEFDWWRDSKITPELLAFEQDVLRFMGKARDMVVEVTDQV